MKEADIAPPPLPVHLADHSTTWLPKLVDNKSKQELEEILKARELVSGLTYSAATMHPYLRDSCNTLSAALSENIRLASQLHELESAVSHQRSSTQAQLLSAHALERQWQQKQSEMDHALGPFSPSSLYQALSQGIQDQEIVCHTLEENYLDGNLAATVATERETSEWARKYIDAKKLYYLREERKVRWDEGRVGGWR